MKTLIHTFALLLLLAGLVQLSEWLWYQYWYAFGRLAMTRSDGYHITRRGRCYTL